MLGTSADPPTYGHKDLLEGLSKLFPKVVTWASENPLKKHGAPLEVRFQLLEALVQSLSIPHVELKQELSSPWTIRTIEKATEYWPDYELVFVIGSDLTGQITTWLKAEVFLQKISVGITEREGWPVQQEQIKRIKAMGGKVALLPLNIPGTASSDVRKKSERSQIPSSVLPILLEQKLYGLGGNKK